MLSDNIIFKSATVLLFTTSAYTLGNTLLKQYNTFIKSDNQVIEVKNLVSKAEIVTLPLNVSVCLYTYLAYKMVDTFFPVKV